MGGEDFFQGGGGLFDDAGVDGGGFLEDVLLVAVADDGPFFAVLGGGGCDGALDGGEGFPGFVEGDGDAVVAGFDLVEGSGEDDFSVDDHGELVGDAFDFFEEVGGEEDGAAFVGHGADDGGEDVAADDGVEAGGGFV